VIDPLGRVRARLDLDRAGVLDASLPAVIDPTPYARSGDYGFWLLVLASVTAAGLAAYYQKTRGQSLN
jgi:apolipoprotein N-acyltransferase